MRFGSVCAPRAEAEDVPASRRRNPFGEASEVGDGKGLRARRGVAPGTRDAGLVEKPPQRGLERLAPAGEEVTNESPECDAIRDRDRRLAMGFEAQEGGFDPRPRREGAGRDGKEAFHDAIELHHDTETAVVPGPRRGQDAISHFALQRAVHVLDMADLRQQAKEQGGGDVIGQVADDAQSPGAGKGAEIERERVLVEEAQRSGAATLATKVLAQVPVDFDRVQLAASSQDGEGECAASGSDLHQRLPRPRIHRFDDAFDDACVVQEVLAESPAGAGPISLAVVASLHPHP